LTSTETRSIPAVGTQANAGVAASNSIAEAAAAAAIPIYSQKLLHLHQLLLCQTNLKGVEACECVRQQDGPHHDRVWPVCTAAEAAATAGGGSSNSRRGQQQLCLQVTSSTTANNGAQALNQNKVQTWTRKFA
jgi:hypothetical protein